MSAEAASVQIAQQFEPLAHRGGGEHGHSGEVATGPVEARDKAVRLYLCSSAPISGWLKCLAV
jgi:hypothetical protein